jgi:outer membrane scaffolding protein for murein synthesis (MipA/OmpV family)
MKLPTILIFATAFAAIPTVQAHAEEKLSATVVLGAGIFPEYEGASARRVFPLVNGRISLGQRYLAVEGLTARANLLASDRFEFGPTMNLTFGRGTNIDSKAVAQLGAIGDAIEVGGFAAWNLPAAGYDRVRFAVVAAHDVTGTHKGWVGTAGVSYIAPISRDWLITVEAAASLVSRDYATTYFSVTSAGAAASGLPKFDANGGVRDVGVTLTASYRLSSRWSLHGFAQGKRLLGDFADSPITSREGNATQVSAALGVGYSF